MRRRSIQLMDVKLLLSIAIGGSSFFFLSSMWELTYREDIKNLLITILDGIVDQISSYNVKKHIHRLKKAKINPKEKKNIISSYNAMVEKLIMDFNLPFTLESFNTLVTATFAISMAIFMMLLENVSLAAMITVAILVASFSFFTMQSRILKSIRTEQIMQVEDLICPLAREGVLNAIKKVLESKEYIPIDIRVYFEQFVDNCEYYGYSFRQAMEILNRQLGSKFDNFAKKAIVFEYNERKGMADIFLDIVDENAALREVNIKKNMVFKKMNRDFLLKLSIVIIFFLYMMSFESMRTFFLSSQVGRAINTLTIVTICLSFARIQSLQNDIDDYREE